MSKKILAISLLAIVSFFVSCSDKQPEAKAASQVVLPQSQPIVPVLPFTAPAKSVITVEKALIYAKASNGLVELGAKWSERIDNSKDYEKIQVLNAYNVARDQLCARAGLQGGIAEYDWITNVALKNPENKLAFEKAGFKVK
ncbi:hypothetical protein [Fibrobacter sp. UWB11]|uniref:hypothetical protein n=1 Tax=Fibrobacter sp. UWB11 TaxID=1896202 RepID=UPI00092AF1E9|nr:hypothetical protein [Fibrobacter sp. UWB11]SIO34324.1 hypothetical protein SAMN05720758_2430 [Fibrobacter sp. UWB11]